MITTYFTEEEAKAFENEQEVVNELIVKYQKKIDDINDLTHAIPAKKRAYLTRLYKALVNLNNAYEDILEL